jgi:hypothetical protein
MEFGLHFQMSSFLGEGRRCSKRQFGVKAKRVNVPSRAHLASLKGAGTRLHTLPSPQHMYLIVIPEFDTL